MATRRLAAALVFTAVAGTAAGQHLYKCGGTYQDRPCADADAQKRYAHGRFEADQANPETDRFCTSAVSELLQYWKRLRSGESLDSLRSQIDTKPASRKEQDDKRDLFTALRDTDATVPRARSQLESQCMAYRQAKAGSARARASESQATAEQSTPDRR